MGEPNTCRVLIHCGAGFSRSPAAVAVLLAQAMLTLPAGDIAGEVLRLRPTAWPNLRVIELGATPGPKKPALDRAFQAMGYSCKGGSGSFSLRRRTAGNLTVELYMDVGTWGHNILAMFRVWGLVFKAVLTVPVTAKAVGGGQYQIGDAGRWQKIVDNLAALVAELDRSFVPEIEAAAGPSPEWYQPET